MSRTGLLLVNLGTPDSPEPSAVRRYLRQFLSDPRVIDLHPIGRMLLLYLIILPFRPRRSAHAYKQIWTTRGSPLLYHSVDLADKVRSRLVDVPVVLGMRYGSPSIEGALLKLKEAGCTHIVVLPLYPQYAASSTGSSLEEVYRVLAAWWEVPSTSVVEPFYDDPGFLSSVLSAGEPLFAGSPAKPDHVLFSFHGLPERHLKKEKESAVHCLASSTCCERIVEANQNCYRAQCYTTARALAGRLGLSSESYSVSFQSRLGRTPWIRPYTDEVIPELARRGVQHLAVYCPAFVADCLETLEEIGIRAKELFLGAGGKEFSLIPAPNSSDVFVDAVVSLFEKTKGGKK